MSLREEFEIVKQSRREHRWFVALVRRPPAFPTSFPLLTYEGELLHPKVSDTRIIFFSREEAERAIVRYALRNGG